MSLIGTTIGKIRIVDRLGKGGMGEVFIGFDEKLKRRVAVKAIHGERRLNPKDKARFIREAEILSSLEHPYICRVYDLLEGDDSDFLVMELIRGRNLDAKQIQKMSYADKLRVTMQMAEVLKVAHERTIIHRDLKPENIMITQRGDVKVLDFGLSYTTSGAPDLTDTPHAPSTQRPDPNGATVTMAPVAQVTGHAFRTAKGTVLGTPRFMSPEQARGERAGAPSDMYAFGLLLQWIFTGKMPYPDGSEVETILRKAARGETLPVEGIDGDLTNLINRLKKPNPDLRPAAEEAIERLQWIASKPLRRTKRWIQAAFTTLLLVFCATTWTQLKEIEKRNVAITTERDRARETADFMENLFLNVDPVQFGSGELSAKAVLDAGARSLASEMHQNVRAKTNLLITVGRVYTAIGQYDDARACLDQAQSHINGVLGEHSTQYRDLFNQFAVLFLRMGEFNEAHCYLDHILPRHAIAEDADDEMLVALSTRAVVYEHQGELDAAEWLIRSLIHELEEKRPLSESQTKDLATDYDNLGRVMQEKGAFEEAKCCYLESLWLRESVFDENHPGLAETHNNLGYLLKNTGDLDAAELHLKEALRLIEQRYAPDHLNVLAVMNNLAALNNRLGNWPESEQLYTEIVTRLRRKLPEDNPYLAYARSNMGRLLLNMHQPDRAEPVLKKSLAFCERNADTAKPLLHATVLLNLGAAAALREDWDRADGHYLDAIPIFERVLGPDHQTVVNVKACQTLAALKTGDQVGFRHGWEFLKPHVEYLGDDTPSVPADLLEIAARIAFEQGDFLRSKAFFERAIDLDLDRFHRFTPVMGYRLEKLAECCLNLGDTGAAGEAIAHLESCWAHLPLSYDYQHTALTRLRERFAAEEGSQ